MTFCEAMHSDRPAVRSEEDTEIGVRDGGGGVLFVLLGLGLGGGVL